MNMRWFIEFYKIGNNMKLQNMCLFQLQYISSNINSTELGMIIHVIRLNFVICEIIWDWIIINKISNESIVNLPPEPIYFCQNKFLLKFGDTVKITRQAVIWSTSLRRTINQMYNDWKLFIKERPRLFYTNFDGNQINYWRFGTKFH